MENVTTELQGREHAVIITPPDTMKPTQVNYLSKPTYSLETSLFWQIIFFSLQEIGQQYFLPRFIIIVSDFQN